MASLSERDGLRVSAPSLPSLQKGDSPQQTRWRKPGADSPLGLEARRLRWVSGWSLCLQQQCVLRDPRAHTACPMSLGSLGCSLLRHHLPLNQEEPGPDGPGRCEDSAGSGSAVRCPRALTCSAPRKLPTGGAGRGFSQPCMLTALGSCSPPSNIFEGACQPRLSDPSPGPMSSAPSPHFQSHLTGTLHSARHQPL